MADFNIQLQSNTNDNLFPKTKSEVVSHGNKTVDVVLNEKVNQTQVSQEARPNTIVERTGTGNINVGTSITFNDTNTNAQLGGIGIGDGNTSLGQPFKGQPMHITGQGDAQIWTSETAPIDMQSSPNTVVKRDGNGNIIVRNGIGYRHPVTGYNMATFYNPDRNSIILKDDNLGTEWTQWGDNNVPIEAGDFQPILGGTVADGNLTYVTQIGKYATIGKEVFINIAIQTNGGTLPTGEIQIKGLPFANRGSIASWTIGYVRGISGGAGKYLGIVCDASPTINFARLIYSDMGSTTVATNVINNTQIAQNGNIHIVASCKLTRVL